MTQSLSDLQARNTKKYRMALAEWIPTEDHKWAKERRLEYLRAEEERLAEHLRAVATDYEKMVLDDDPGFDRLLFGKMTDIVRDRRRLKSIRSEMQALMGGSTNDLSPSEIERARAVPLGEVVQAKNGYILCPFHDDTKPSMWVKNGFGYCFTCSAHCDSIGYLMKVQGLSFKQAVRELL